MGKTYKVRLSPTVIDTMSGGGEHFWHGAYTDTPERLAEWRVYLAAEFAEVASMFEDIVRRGGAYPSKTMTVDADETALRWLGIHASWIESCGEAGQPTWGRAGRALCNQLDKIAAQHGELSDYRMWLLKQRTPRWG